MNPIVDIVLLLLRLYSWILLARASDPVGFRI